MTKHEAIIELAREQIAKGFPFRLTVYGSSMLPSIPSGSVVNVVQCAFDSLKLGDVVLFRSGGGFRCHRVIKELSGEGCARFHTRGDFTLNEDAPLTEEMFIGRVSEVLTRAGAINLDSPVLRIYGRFAAAASPLAGLLRRIKFKIINKL